MSNAELQLEVLKYQVELQRLKNESPEAKMQSMFLALVEEKLKLAVDPQPQQSNEDKVSSLLRQCGYDEDDEFLSRPVVSVSAAAAELEMSEETIRGWCRDGRIYRCEKRGNRWFVCPKSVTLELNGVRDPRL